MESHSHIFEIKDISYSYPGGKTVLENFSFTLHHGQKAGLIGHNGSGKTTLLHLLMGLLVPTAGTIHILGEKMESEKDFKAIRPKLGFVFQNADDQLFSPTVLEDVAFGPLNLGKSPKEARDIAMNTLEALDLKGFEKRISYKLSGGEKKLVSIATVLAMDPEVLLLDEPTTGLDMETREHIIQILNDLDKSFLIVSHEYDFLARTTRDFFGMQKGKILYYGDSSALHTHTHIHPLGDAPHRHNGHETHDHEDGPDHAHDGHIHTHGDHDTRD
ncbi:MAG: ABC transporter ATP-binding protein [Desulfatibacillum sp.]|nr:ABC transporter ATP-binding protein [Desulfatibacillum sp.]